MRKLGVTVAAGLVALSLAACGSSSSSESAGSASGGTLSGTMTVFAAASLTGSFTQLGKQFEAAHPGTKVTFSFGPSSGPREPDHRGLTRRRVRVGQRRPT